MEPLKLKKGHLVVYLVLIAAVLAVMLMARNAAMKGAKASGGQTDAPSDTLRIAMQMSPVGVTAVGDTLGGYYYDKVRQIAAKEHFHPLISGITNVVTAVSDLDAGVYDIVIADTTGVNLSAEHIVVGCSDEATDSIKCQLRTWAVICTNPELSSLISYQ